jgi:DNA-binding transcriptional ArsR family regulator
MNNRKKASKRAKTPRSRQAAVLTLTDLERLKLLAEPIRLRLLGAFMDEKTTKQVATELGEKPTRLYHHVAALERAGLLELTRTAPNRGTTEKYYRAVARTFRGNVGVLQSGAPAGAELGSVVRTMLATTADEAEQLLAAGRKHALVDGGVLGFLELRISARLATRVRRDLMAVLDRVQDEKAGASGGEPVRCRLAIAFFPLDE